MHLRRFELLSRYRHTDLNRARLPIPPQVQILNCDKSPAELSAVPAQHLTVPEIKDFDRCAFSSSLNLPPAALGLKATNSATGAIITSAINFITNKKYGQVYKLKN